MLLPLAATVATAQVEYVSNLRRISIATSADGFLDEAAVTHNGDFTATVSHSVPFSVNGVTGINSGIGFISCHFENGLKGRTRLRGSGRIVPDAPAITGLATTDIDLTFTLAQPSPFYVLTRGEGLSQDAAESVSYNVSSAGGEETFADVQRDSLGGLSLSSGVLPAGTHRFRYVASISAAGDESDRDVRFEIVFAPPPCPADFNEDGSVDGSDVEAFFIDWMDGDETADVNFDGGVDGADVETFFVLWEAGGC
jgi:hypothetical protein